MLFRSALAAALVLAATPNLVFAQAAEPVAQVKNGAWVFSADGRRIGRIDGVTNGLAAIIYNGRLIRLSVDKLAPGEKGLTSALTRKEIDKLGLIEMLRRSQWLRRGS